MNRSRIYTLGILAICLGGVTGCTTLKLPDYPAKTVEQHPFAKTVNGLAIGITPLTDSRECKRYFGTDLLSAGLLPIAVTCENRAHDSSFILERNRFRVGNVSEGGEKTKGRVGDETAALVLANMYGIGTMLVGAKMGSDAKVIKHNFMVKELQATTLSPGKRAGGFLYFELPKSSASREQTVHLEALNPATREYSVIEIPFR